MTSQSSPTFEKIAKLRRKRLKIDNYTCQFCLKKLAEHLLGIEPVGELKDNEKYTVKTVKTICGNCPLS